MEDDPADSSSALRDAVKKLVAEANTNSKIRIAKQSVGHIKKIVVRFLVLVAAPAREALAHAVFCCASSLRVSYCEFSEAVGQRLESVSCFVRLLSRLQYCGTSAARSHGHAFDCVWFLCVCTCVNRGRVTVASRYRFLCL